MTFVTVAFLLASFCFLFGGLSAWAGYKSGGAARGFLLIYAAAFMFLSLFSVLVGTGFGIELTNQAECENVINSTEISGNITSYTYVDSCASASIPASIGRLYYAYSSILLTVMLASVFGLMFLGIRTVVLKW